MRFVIVTGMSGAGRNSVMKMLEDMGYFCGQSSGSSDPAYDGNDA